MKISNLDLPICENLRAIFGLIYFFGPHQRAFLFLVCQISTPEEMRCNICGVDTFVLSSMDKLNNFWQYILSQQFSDLLKETNCTTDVWCEQIFKDNFEIFKWQIVRVDCIKSV